jgi:methylated-DNA-[protein]-cysteine S-methyltransferase
MAIHWTGQTLSGFAIGHPSAAAAVAASDPDRRLSDDPPDFVCQLMERLQAYAAGGDVDFGDVPLDLSHLTEFQRRVVQQCRKIAPGRTVTYADLATKAGHPGAARAVGNTMAANRFPIVIPCHRVVGSAGSLGGFSAPAGISLKQKMLELENRSHQTKSRPR